MIETLKLFNTYNKSMKKILWGKDKMAQYIIHDILLKLIVNFIVIEIMVDPYT